MRRPAHPHAATDGEEARPEPARGQAGGHPLLLQALSIDSSAVNGAWGEFASAGGRTGVAPPRPRGKAAMEAAAPTPTTSSGPPADVASSHAPTHAGAGGEAEAQTQNPLPAPSGAGDWEVSLGEDIPADYPSPAQTRAANSGTPPGLPSSGGRDVMAAAAPYGSGTHAQYQAPEEPQTHRIPTQEEQSAAYQMAKAGSLGVNMNPALVRAAVILIRSTGLLPHLRPHYIENPHDEFIFLEDRSARRYSRNKERPYDNWSHIGGTSLLREWLPADLQAGPELQSLERRSGKVIRHALTELRFHQYQIVTYRNGPKGPEKVPSPILFHVIPHPRLGRENWGPDPDNPEAAEAMEESPRPVPQPLPVSQDVAGKRKWARVGGEMQGSPKNPMVAPGGAQASPRVRIAPGGAQGRAPAPGGVQASPRAARASRPDGSMANIKDEHRLPPAGEGAPVSMFPADGQVGGLKALGHYQLQREVPALLLSGAPPHRIVLVNSEWCRWACHRPENVIGQTLAVSHGARTEVDRFTAVKAALSNGHGSFSVLTNYTAEGLAFRNTMSIMPVSSNMGLRTPHFLVLCKIDYPTSRPMPVPRTQLPSQVGPSF